MQLSFLIDKKYTFLQAFNAGQNKIPFEGWKDFTLEKWDKHPQECYLLAGFAEWPLLDKSSMSSVAKKAEELLEKWLKSKENKKLLEETEEYQDWLKKEWTEKSKKVLKEFEEIIKMSLPKKEITVYITHPKLKNGLTVNPNIIVWGHEEEWPNYSMVYLCHEVLHTMFWGDNSEVTHSIIELATDQELRLRLNENGKYFDVTGHPNLKKTEQKLLPDWKDYLKNSHQNLREFIRIKKADR